MKSAENRFRHDLAEPLDWSRQRRILGQSKMWPDIVVVSGIRRKNATQVILARDHDVIEALPSDRADQPLRMAILPGRARRNRMIPDPHRRKTSRYGMAIASV